MERAILELVYALTRDLAARNYAAIEGDGRAGRLTGSQLASAVAKYGRTVAPLPDEAALLIDVYPNALDPSRMLIDVPVWTLEEGRSDLTLSLEVVRLPAGYVIRIVDLHVL